MLTGPFSDGWVLCPGWAFGLRRHSRTPATGLKRPFIPTLDELSAELGQELLPFILLLSPEDDDGYVRLWQPRDSGPGMHYGYAFQWFAMAAAGSRRLAVANLEKGAIEPLPMSVLARRIAARYSIP